MKKRINISLDEETVEMVKKIAEFSHKSVSQWISDSVWDFAKEHEISIQEREKDDENSL